MKKLFTLLSLCIAITLLPHPVKAELLLSEDFSYTAGNLYNQGGWVKYSSHNLDPIQVVVTPLTYKDYQTEAIGGAVKIGSSDLQGQDLQKAFPHAVTNGFIYVSTLINVETAGTNYFLTLVDSLKGKPVTDGSNGSEKIRLLTIPGSEGKFKVQLGKGNSTYVTAAEEYDLNKTYLFVIKYTFQGDVTTAGTDDIVELFINPTVSATEPTQPAITLNGNYGSDIGTRGANAIQIKQGHTSSKTCPTLTIDALRVGTTWADIMNQSTPPEPTTAIIPSTTKISFDAPILQGDIRTATFTVKGTELKGDITLTPYHSNIRLSTTTVTKAEAESATGKEITVTLTATTAGDNSGSVLLESEGAVNVIVVIEDWYTNPIEECTSIANIREKFTPDADNNDYHLFRLDKATVTHTFVNNDITYLYLQDETGAITIKDDYQQLTTTYKVGDVLENTIGNLAEVYGVLYYIPVMPFGAPVETGQLIEPATITLNELLTNPKSYEAKLVKVTGVSLSNTDGKYTLGSSVDMTQGETTGAKLRVVPGVDFLDAALPAYAVDVVGVSTAANGKIIAPRSSADITRTPVITEIIPSATSLTFGDDYTYIFKGDILTTTFTVKGKNLTGDITLACDHSDITLSATTVTKAEAESATGKEITVTLTANTIETQKAKITLSSNGAEETTVDITTWYVFDFVACNSIADLRTRFTDDGTGNDYRLFRLGKTTVTHTFVNNDITYIYLQDATGGITVEDPYQYLNRTYTVGDVLDKTVGTLSLSFGTLYYMPMLPFGEPVETGQLIEPALITLDELLTNPKPYEAMLVKIAGVTLSEKGGKYALGSKVEMTQGETTGAKLRVVPGVDFLDTELPAYAVDVVGVSTNAKGTAVAPRSSADITKSQGTGIEDIATTTRVYASNGMLYIESNATQAAVYNIAGKLVATLTLSDGKATLPLAQGMYLVKTDKITNKLIVQ